MDTQVAILGNMNETGGGMAYGITGKYESNRHALAKLTKLTFGEAAAALKLKKNGGFNISAADLIEAYRATYGEPEWHHAGFLPKNYGGGMKKTYFLKELPTVVEVEEWLKNKSEKSAEALKAENKKQTLAELQAAYRTEHNATTYTRVTQEPLFSIRTAQEMKGKYGWFDSTNKTYNMIEYFSGFAFATLQELKDYENLSNQI